LSHSAVILLSLPRTPRSLLFPYTTLFRSDRGKTSSRNPLVRPNSAASNPAAGSHDARTSVSSASVPSRGVNRPSRWTPSCATTRSEEHTSELQSPCNLVCRLLLEKKKDGIGSDGVKDIDISITNTHFHYRQGFRYFHLIYRLR